MTIAVLLLVLAVWCHIKSARIISHENDGHRLPTIYGENPVRPGQHARRLQTAGWILSIIGALRIGDALWLDRPGWSIVVVISLLLCINSIPAFAVTVLHNSRVRSA